ncbi:MAG: Rieske 2Fe-2S domain-containing protein [Chloroflexi bacterium]|nr:Rieske 2Fe-2S domain-containing protein [Chloroflexota bacterium]OJV88748.1 MAG: hypothetical protein BGO39_04395 [Chloroflexi bacterium 54-19]
MNPITDEKNDEKKPSRRVRAGKVEKLTPGTKKLVEDKHEDVVVVNVNGEYFAVSGFCPHAGGFLGFGYLEGHKIECPMHSWQFDLRNGCLDGMENCSPYDRLNTYPVIVEDGEVFVEFPAGA